MCAMPGRRLDGVRAVVTGAASGIGRSTAEAFVREGASVIVVDVNDEALGSVVDALGSSAIPVVADLARPNAGDGVAAEAEAFLGEIDVVVNNAGVSSKARFGQVLEQEWELLFRVNVDAAFQIAQRAVRSMIARRSGCILNVSSISGRGGGAPQSVYGITKGALLGLTREMAADLTPFGIRVNAVLPGVIDTPMVRRDIAAGGDADGSLLAAWIRESVPAARLGRPEEVAEVLVFLASADAASVSGCLFPVEGGFLST